MSHMTKIEGVPDSDSAKPGMAFFAATGPFGKTCGDCKHRGYFKESSRGRWDEGLQQLVYRGYRVQKCDVARRMNGGKHMADVDAANHACKYFESKEKPTA